MKIGDKVLIIKPIEVLLGDTKLNINSGATGTIHSHHIPEPLMTIT